MIEAVQFKIRINIDDRDDNVATASTSARMGTGYRCPLGGSFNFITTDKQPFVISTDHIFVSVSQVPELHFAFSVQRHFGGTFSVSIVNLISVPNVNLLEAFAVRSTKHSKRQMVSLEVNKTDLLTEWKQAGAIRAQAVLKQQSFASLNHPSDCLAKVPFPTLRLLKYFLMDAKHLSDQVLTQEIHRAELTLDCIDDDNANLLPLMKVKADDLFQVWSLTLFYSVDFSKSRIGGKSGLSTNAQSRFASVVVDGVLGPPRLARNT